MLNHDRYEDAVDITRIVSIETVQAMLDDLNLAYHEGVIEYDGGEVDRLAQTWIAVLASRLAVRQVLNEINAKS